MIQTVVRFGHMIRFSHSLFALPFALGAALLAARQGYHAEQFLWILVAMVGARSAAMGFNRLVDHQLDAANPRTAGRELPQGTLSRGAVIAFVVVAAAAFVVAAGMLNRTCLLLSPVALAIVFGYSYTKRFTYFSHVALGLGLAVAPVGAWLAIRGSFAPEPLILAGAVVAWVAGFDIIYACQDVEFDRQARLHSIPARWGVARALVAARLLHAAAITLLGIVGVVATLHPAYFAGVAVIGALLVVEHRLVHANDLSRVNAAFFTVNGWISVAYLASVAVAVWLR
jgi:4-hydroxybenzoate polyprenyltransferase